jgi:hypothetical protein
MNWPYMDCYVMDIKALNFYIMNWFFVLIYDCDNDNYISALSCTILFLWLFCMWWVIMYSDMFYILCPAWTERIYGTQNKVKMKVKYILQ